MPRIPRRRTRLPWARADRRRARRRPCPLHIPRDRSQSACPATDFFRPRRSPSPLTPQFEPLDLSRRRLRQLGEELDPARILVGRELVLDVLLEPGLQRAASPLALLGDDEAFRFEDLVLVLGADYRGCEAWVVRDESGFAFSGRDVDTGNFQHVVRAPAVYVVAVAVEAVLVAALRPPAHEGVAALVVVIPVAGGARRPADLKLPHLALLHWVAALVHQAQLVSRHGVARRAVAQVVPPVA